MEQLKDSFAWVIRKNILRVRIWHRTEKRTSNQEFKVACIGAILKLTSWNLSLEISRYESFYFKNVGKFYLIILKIILSVDLIQYVFFFFDNYK